MSAAPAADGFRTLWSAEQPHSLRGVAVCREKGWVLAWDAADWIYLLGGEGQPQGQVHAPAALAAVCGADDGSAFAAVGGTGEVAWLAPDLRTRWERSVPYRAVAAAMDPFGQYLAVADVRGGVAAFDRHGRRVFRAEAPRPLHHLAFVPAAPFLVGSADYGLAACLDASGNWAWRDGLVAHVGGLAVSGDGEQIVLSCFSDGLQRYALDGSRRPRLAASEPCRLVTASFDGRLLLVAGLSSRVELLRAEGPVLRGGTLSGPPVALAMTPLGDRAVVARAEGGMAALALGG